MTAFLAADMLRLLHALSRRAHEIDLDRLLSHQKGILDRLCIASAVADDAHAVQAQQRRSAGLGVIHLFLEWARYVAYRPKERAEKAIGWDSIFDGAGKHLRDAFTGL